MYEACVCVNVDECADPYEQSTRTAKKKYACSECGDDIKIGDKYEYVRGRWNGDWSTFRTCKTCVNVRRDLFQCGWTHGSMWEDIYYAFEEAIPPEEEDDLSWLK